MSAETNVETVTLTIDGAAVTVPKGTNVLEAARTLGADISAFCYHPGLSIAACCRQCLVTVEKAPKLAPSCQTTCAEGMVVHTKDAASTDARRQMLEFTLVNHPIDCPICDKAGECTLQKLYVENNNQASRVDVPKVHKPKVKDLGPHVVLDAERCILCTRCIRVCDEVAGEHQLEMAHRGNHEELGCAPGAVLDNPYSLNTVDVCPVGALTSKDFRFTMRAWELSATPSICMGCSTGCNTELHSKDDRVWRIVPRHNPTVNKYWMSDEGRFKYHALRETRLAAPTLGGLPSTWDKALDAAAALIKRHGKQVAFVASFDHGNEDNFALLKLAQAVGGPVFASGSPRDESRADNILRDADKAPNRAGVTAMAQGLGMSLGDDAAFTAAAAAGSIHAAVVLGTTLTLQGIHIPTVVIASHEVGAAKHAHIALPAAAWAEMSGTTTNRQHLTQRFHAAVPPPGLAKPAWQGLAELAARAGTALAFKNAKEVFTAYVAVSAMFAEAKWGRDVRPLQLRFAGSRG